MRVGRYNYPQQFDGHLDGIISEYRDILLSGAYIGSEHVTNFERAFAAFSGCRFGRGTNTGTDALAVALMALGVGPGHEVITQANTFNATVTAIRMAGAKPVLVDADPHTFLIDEAAVESAVTSNTRVLMPVHLYGKPTPMAGLQRIAQRYGLLIVEDAAQAHGARIEGQCVGSFGDAGCFSFHPSKNLAAAGDAGCITTNSLAIASRIELVRSLGQRTQNEHVSAGMNTRLDALQAVVLASKLPRLDDWNAARRAAARAYRARLSDLPLFFQAESIEEEHVYHLFQVGCDRRDALLDYLTSRDIDAVVRYPWPIHLQGAFQAYKWRRGQFPVAERLADSLLCLPIRPDLSESEIDFVSDTVRRFFSD